MIRRKINLKSIVRRKEQGKRKGWSEAKTREREREKMREGLTDIERTGIKGGGGGG